VKVGSSDELTTEVSGDGVKEGMRVVIGEGGEGDQAPEEVAEGNKTKTRSCYASQRQPAPSATVAPGVTAHGIDTA